MPKWGVNQRSQAAKQRKNDVIQQKRVVEQERIQAAKWVDREKSVVQREQRKKKRQSKKQQELQKKQENKRLYSQEEKKFVSNKACAPVQKLTVQSDKQKLALLARLQKQQQAKKKLNQDINPNHEYQQLQQEIPPTYDGNPNQRMKAAWNRFYQKKYPIYKKSNPQLRRGKLLELMQREWKKSPDNPINKPQNLLQVQTSFHFQYIEE